MIKYSLFILKRKLALHKLTKKVLEARFFDFSEISLCNESELQEFAKMVRCSSFLVDASATVYTLEWSWSLRGVRSMYVKQLYYVAQLDGWAVRFHSLQRGVKDEKCFNFFQRDVLAGHLCLRNYSLIMATVSTVLWVEVCFHRGLDVSESKFHC